MFIEIIKIVVGLLIAGVAGTWTLYTWQVNENTRSDEAIIAISDVIVLTHINCRMNDGALNNLFGTVTNDTSESENRLTLCLKNLVKLRQLAYAGQIKISAPFDVNDHDWNSGWEAFQRAVEDAGSKAYNRVAIDDAWKAILKKKGE